MTDFAGQVVIVTGAGRGLGRLYALEFARRGASVIVNDLGCAVDGEGSDPSAASQVAEEIEQAGGAALASHESVASPAAEDVAAHLAEISATEPFTVPGSIYDEIAGICTRLGII